MNLVLASQSPRRRELLLEAGYEFTVSPVKLSENIEENLNPEENASHLATQKARACLDQNKELKPRGNLILAADTIVALGDQILGKPTSVEEARSFLRLLSGRAHRVITGLSLIETGSERLWEGFDQTEVVFRTLSEEEIREYVATGEPMDKAGGYGIQGRAARFVSSTSGSWSNVVGLPLERLERVLEENGWHVRRQPPRKSKSENRGE